MEWVSNRSVCSHTPPTCPATRRREHKKTPPFAHLAGAVGRHYLSYEVGKKRHQRSKLL